MKVRTGFVSNSSSASFIVNWRLPQDTGWSPVIWVDNGEITKSSIIDATLEWSKNETEKEHIKKCTIEEDGFCTTRLWTSMYNDMSSFSEEINCFVNQLLVDNLLISARVIEDY